MKGQKGCKGSFEAAIGQRQKARDDWKGIGKAVIGQGAASTAKAKRSSKAAAVPWGT